MSEGTWLGLSLYPGHTFFFQVFSANEKESKIHNIFSCSYSRKVGSPAALIPM